MEQLSLVVIGGTAAGMSAATKARKLSPDLPITVYERTNYVTYGSCGIPYYVGGEISDYNDLISFTPTYLKDKRNIDVKIGHEVLGIDLNKKIITVRALSTGNVINNTFKKLVIATGASPILPNILGVDSPLVCKVRVIEDGLKIKSKLEKGSIQSAIILGAGFIGLEMAEALAKWGIKVVILEALPIILQRLNPMLASLIEEELVRNDIKLYKNSKVNNIISNTENNKAVVNTGDGKKFDANMIIASVGVRPNTQIAEISDIKIGLNGGIVVDKYMETNVRGVWACGDCVQMWHLISESPCWFPLGTTANKQGKIAGENAVGGRSSFPGVLGTQVTKVFDLYIALTGLSEIEAQRSGFDANLVQITHHDKASYYPNNRDVHIAMIIDNTSGRVLGAQLVGSEMAALRINVFATAITAGMTVHQLAELDLAYAPPIAPVYDPVLVAGIVGVKKIQRRGI